MKLKLERPIIFFDLETTGLTIGKDHIVELCYIRIEPNGCERAETLRFNPGIHIPKECSDIHGITDDDVKHYTALNAAREREAKEKELNDQRNYYRSLIKAAEKQDKLYTAEEAKTRRMAWINVQNEGGEGYVPHFYTIDEVEAAKRWLDAHQEGK
jgi:DNA polymerase III alpha subunit (gram-positive type)